MDRRLDDLLKGLWKWTGISPATSPPLESTGSLHRVPMDQATAAPTYVILVLHLFSRLVKVLLNQQ